MTSGPERFGVQDACPQIDAVSHYACSRPQHVACADLRTGEKISYRELDARIDERRSALNERLGGRPLEKRVALLARNSLDSVVFAFACERLGAIFVPLNWRLSAPEIASIIADCDPAAIFVQPEFQELAADAVGGEASVDAKLFDITSPLSNAAPSITSAPSPDPDQVATLLYTSGTTGRAKGVMMTRAAGFFIAKNFAAVSRMGPDAVMLWDAPAFHVVGLYCVVRTTLHCGGTLLISDRFLPADALRRLSTPETGITHYFGVPQMAQAISDLAEFEESDLGGLRAFFVGGAPLAEVLIDRYLRKRVALVNGYGLSEAGTVLGMPVDLEQIRAHKTAAGLPAPHVQLRIVSTGDGAGVRQVGEVWVKGPATFRGYWKKPEESANAHEQGWFKTGDAAWRDEEGFVHIVDRLTDMYITGGENVYPAEVEAVIAKCAGVADVGVVGVPDKRWGESGRAFVVLKAGAHATEESIATHCARHLARYKCPKEIVFIGSLPRTASGKIEKRALRENVVGKPA